MIPGAMAKRYATALFSAASAKGLLEEIKRDMDSFEQLVTVNPALENFILSPQVRTDDKKDLLRRNLRGRVSALFIDFLHLLIDKKRFDFAREIFAAFTDLYEKHAGIVEVKAVTAVPLSAELEAKMEAKLEEQLQKRVRLSKEVDPGIIGGMVLRIDNKIIDGSIRFNLERLRRNLKEVRVN